MKFRYALTKFKQFIIDRESLVLALPFSLVAIIVSVNYILGIAFVPNAYIRYSNFIQEFIFFVLIISLGMIVIKNFLSLTKVFLSLPIIFYIVSFLVSIFLFGITSHLVSYLLHFLVFSIPAYLVGTIIAKNGREIQLLEGLNKWSFFVLPIVIHYVFMEFANTQPIGTESGYLGIYTYMTVAYMVLPFFFSWFLKLLCLEKSGYERKFSVNKVINIIMIIIYWVSILYTGTRGAILCGVCFSLSLSLYSVISRNKNRIRIILVACMIIIILLVGSFWPALSMTRLSRFVSLHNVVSDYQSTQSEISDNNVQNIADGTLGTTVARDNDFTNKTKDKSKDTIGPSHENRLPEITSGNFRIIIYGEAFREIKNNPLTGLGPLGFYYKYHPQYPHNIFLELLVECGIIVGGLATVYLIIRFFRFSILSKKKCDIALIFLMLLGYVIYFMVSGTVWNNPTLLFFLGYSISIQQEHQNKSLAG